MPSRTHSPRRKDPRAARRLFAPCLERLEDRTLPATGTNVIQVSTEPGHVGAFDPKTATWFLRSSATPGAPDGGQFQYGAQGWVAVSGDWLGNGQAGIGAFDPATATWYLRSSATPGAPDVGKFQFGAPGWIPLTGDWTGSGKTGIGVFDPTTATFYLRTEANAGAPDAGKFAYGAPTWIPVTGDWTGTGHTGIGAVDPTTETWYLRKEAGPGGPDAGKFAYGAATWIPVTGNWSGTGHTGIGVVDPATNTWYLRNEVGAGLPDAGKFAYGAAGLQPVVGNWQAAPGGTAASTGTKLLSLNLNPLDINLLGLEVKTDQIQVNVSAQPGNGQLLGNLLSAVGNLLNLQGVNTALNNVLGSVVSLLNSTSLNVGGVNTSSGSFSSAPTNAAATTPVLDLFVAPVHLNLLGALVDTSPIHLQILAHSGSGLILGNVVADLANLFNPPLPSTLNLDDINARLVNLLNDLNSQISIPAAPVSPVTIQAGSNQVLALTLAPINVNLLGLVLKTTQIQVNVDANPGNGNLLGNVLTTLLNTLGATPQNLTALSNNLSAILAKVIGVLNASSLTLPSSAVSSLSQVLQTLSLPNLINASGSASAPILNLAIASTDGTTPPVDVNLLGLVITTSDIQAQLLAQTGDGLILGNLLYNVANLLNPGGALNLLTILNELAL